MNDFDYGAPAELFPSKRTGSRFSKVTYKRFASAAIAIQFAIENLDLDKQSGAVLEVDDERYDLAAIRSLYDSDDYPFEKPRTTP